MTDQALQRQSDSTAPTPQNLAAEMVPRSWGELQQFAEVVSQSQLCPKSYRGKPQDAALAILYGMELGLRPLQSLQSVAVINGRPSIYGDAALALVEQSGLAEYVKEWQERTDDRGLVAYCETQKKGKPEPTTQSFSEKEAKHAGLWGNRGPWESYPRRMLQMRARSWCLRDAYPEVLEGLMLAEEAEAIPESNGPTLDPQGDLSQSEPPENGKTAQEQQRQEFRNGVSIPTDQAKVYDKWNARLSELEGEELHDAIDTAEETMATWGEDRQLLKRTLTDLLDEHRNRLGSSGKATGVPSTPKSKSTKSQSGETTNRQNGGAAKGDTTGGGSSKRQFRDLEDAIAQLMPDAKEAGMGPPPPEDERISDKQRKRLFAISKDNDWKDSWLERLIKDELGFESRSMIPWGSPYDQICEGLEHQELKYWVSRDPDTKEMQFDEPDAEHEGTPLPEGMDNRNFLVSAGVDTVQKLHKVVSSAEHQLEDLDGIGEKTAESARNWLEEHSA